MQEINKAPEQLVGEIRKLVLQLTEMTKSQVSGTQEPIIHGNGMFDIAALDGFVRVSLGSDFGWVASKFDPAFASNIAGQIQAAAILALLQRLPQPINAKEPPPIH